MSNCKTSLRMPPDRRCGQSKRRVCPLQLTARFGMAEQAINTIYLLGEQPDALCSQMIKNMTTKVFTSTSTEAADAKTSSASDEAEAETQETLQVPPTPARTVDMSAPTPHKLSRSESQESLKDDHAGSFPLAQLVFVVGHVAIKHIVYLELVEREFKRRKDEKAKGEQLSNGSSC